MPKPVLVDLDFQNTSRVTNIPAPLAVGDAANKAYVDGLVEGLAWKDDVRVSTTANLNLAAPGAAIDGITMVVNDRVLVRAQTAPAENGIYIFNGGATPATRSLDTNTYDKLEQAVVSISEGTSAGTTFRQTGINGAIGTTAVTWGSFGTAAPAASEITSGIAEIATQVETDAGTDDLRIVTPLKLATYVNRAKRFAVTFGDAAATSYIITHNLGTQDVEVFVRETGGSLRQAEVEVQMTTVNSVTILTKAAPALNSLRAVVIA